MSGVQVDVLDGQALANIVPEDNVQLWTVDGQVWEGLCTTCPSVCLVVRKGKGGGEEERGTLHGWPAEGIVPPPPVGSRRPRLFCRRPQTLAGSGGVGGREDIGNPYQSAPTLPSHTTSTYYSNGTISSGLTTTAIPLGCITVTPITVPLST